MITQERLYRDDMVEDETVKDAEALGDPAVALLGASEGSVAIHISSDESAAAEGYAHWGAKQR